MIGAQVGHYVIKRELGHGGMGAVYLARSRAGRAVALKVVKAEYAADPRFRARFRKEVEAARKVGGFHTAAVVDADPDAPQPWMASAYVKGPTLDAEIRRRGALSESELWALGAALAEALEAIHACGLVHRDLKPANIILAEDGPRVLDFGIARALEGTGLTGEAVIGTAGFIAPEQVRADGNITGACDVFALGAVLVAAAGGSAFGEGTPYAMLYRAVHERADLSAVPGALRDVVRACLRKEPERRPTPRELLNQFTGGAAATPIGGAGHEAEPADAAPTRVGTPDVAPALYRRDRQALALHLATTASSGVGSVVGIVVGAQFFDQVPWLMVLSVIGAVIAGARLIGLLTASKDGLVLGDAGIGVGGPDTLAVVGWGDVRSVELSEGGTLLTLRVEDRQGLPVGFQHPTWVRKDRQGATRIRTRLLAPAEGAAPLPDTVRALAARHGVPLTEAER
ncbi:serine/threonine-protein kinase [Streptomyces sp. G45]|uniref:serine/threonine-protein kinase n=1 Tax=Streptomyces sp. G45 TaxID=3406627 RepID=UPI003C1545F7